MTINFHLCSSPFTDTIYFCPSLGIIKKAIFAFNDLPENSDILILKVLDSNEFYQIKVNMDMI